MRTLPSLLNPNLRGFYETKGKRNFVLYGGRSSSKTYHTAAFCIYLACTYGIKFLCVRQFQNRIADSVKTVLEECIYRLGIEDEFDITATGIEHRLTGATFTFLGIQRNLREIKGIAGVEILWIEEAEDLSDEQWQVLEPTIRAENSKVFVVFNPRFATDFAFKRFVVNPPPDTIARKINFDENPFLSDTIRKIIEAMRVDDPDKFEHIYGGEPKQDDEGVVIKRSWVITAIDAHKTLSMQGLGRKRMGFDVADSGDDKCAVVLAQGSIVTWADQWKASEDELLKSCTRVYHAARDRNASITYDSIGVGASAGAKFAELNAAVHEVYAVRFEKFNAGGGVFKPDSQYEPNVKNKDQFSNIKAQAWWLLADRFRNTFNAVRNGAMFDESDLISLDSSLPHLVQLIDELTTPLRDYDPNGRVKVESKKDLAKRGVSSPNLADALVMAFAPTQAPMKISSAALASA